MRFHALDTDKDHLVSSGEFSKSKSSFLPDFSITHRGGVQEVKEIKGGAATLGDVGGAAAVAGLIRGGALIGAGARKALKH